MYVELTDEEINELLGAVDNDEDDDCTDEEYDEFKTEIMTDEECEEYAKKEGIDISIPETDWKHKISPECGGLEE